MTSFLFPINGRITCTLFHLTKVISRVDVDGYIRMVTWSLRIHCNWWQPLWNFSLLMKGWNNRSLLFFDLPSFIIQPSWIFVISYNNFSRDKITKYVEDCFKIIGHFYLPVISPNQNFRLHGWSVVH